MSQTTFKTKTKIKIKINFNTGDSWVCWRNHRINVNYRFASSLVRDLGIADKMTFINKSYYLTYNPGVQNEAH